MKQVKSNINREKAQINKKNNEYNNLNVKEGLDIFLQYRKKMVDEGDLDLDTYVDDIKTLESRFIRDNKLLKYKITSVDKDIAQEFTNELNKSVKMNSGKEEKLSINTIYKPFAFIRKTFSFFKEELKIIDDNPFMLVKNKPQTTANPQKYLIDNEIKYTIEKLNNETIRSRFIINLMLETGLRIEEICGLKLGGVKLKRQSIVTEMALVKVNGELRLKKLKTKDSERELAVSDYCIDLFNKYIVFKKACGIVANEEDLIFTGYDGEWIAPSQYSKDWQKIRDKIKLDKVPMKNLRHSSVTFMLNDNPNIKAVQTRSGHSKPATTLSYYNQSNLYEDRKLVNKYSEAFHNSLGFTIGELYRISVGRIFSKKRTIELIEKITNKNIDNDNFEEELTRCQDYFMELFPMFQKISKIDDILDEEEIDKLFEGFKNSYQKVQIKELEDLSIKI